MEKYEKSEAGVERWRLLCCAALTHTEWINFPQHVTVLSFPRHELTYAAVKQMSQLLSIDLRHTVCALWTGWSARSGCGTSTCRATRTSTSSHTHQLGSLTTLEHVNTLPTPTTNFTEHYQRVISALFPATAAWPSSTAGRSTWPTTCPLCAARPLSRHGRGQLTGYPRQPRHTRHRRLRPCPSRSPSRPCSPACSGSTTLPRAATQHSLALMETASLLPFRSLTLLSLSNNRLTSIVQLQLGELPRAAVAGRAWQSHQGYATSVRSALPPALRCAV